MNIEDILPIEIWYRICIYLNNSHDSINLLYVSKFTRQFVLSKYDKYFILSSGFCTSEFWERRLGNNRFNILSILYTKLDMWFDYDFWSMKLKQSMHHLSLFSVCLHFLRCYRRCNKLPESQYCFFCSRIRARNFEKPSYFLDIVIDEHDFEEQFCNMTTSLIELDISVERPVYFPDSIRKDMRCDYYQEFHKEGELLVSFTSVLVRIYINYVLDCLLELDLTLRNERILMEGVYTPASDLMSEFFKKHLIFFNLVFMNFLICAFQRISISEGVMVSQGKNSIMGLMNKLRFVVTD